MDFSVPFAILAFLSAIFTYDTDDDFTEDIPRSDSDGYMDTVVPLEDSTQSVLQNPLQIALSRIYEIKRKENNLATLQFAKKLTSAIEPINQGIFRTTNTYFVKTIGIANYGPTPGIYTEQNEAILHSMRRTESFEDRHKSNKEESKIPKLGHKQQTLDHTTGQLLKLGSHDANTSSLFLRFKWPNKKTGRIYKFYSENDSVNNLSNNVNTTMLNERMDLHYKDKNSQMTPVTVAVPKSLPTKFKCNNCEKNGKRSTTSKRVQGRRDVQDIHHVLGLDVEIWQSEKMIRKQEMAKKMLLHDENDYFHYLSNVPKLNRKLKLVHPKDDTSIADALAAKVKVLCWVITHPANHNKMPVAIKNTWGKKCTKLIFFSTEYDASIPTVKLPVKEGRDYLWGKMKAAISYIYKHHRHEADWFLRTDDDTYIIMENLRYLLSSFDYRKPLYLGCRFKPYTPQGYMSGGAGMVLSREALDRVVKRGLRVTKLCDVGDEGDDDDAKIGICLHRVGVKAVDTRDSEQRGRFWPFSPQDHVVPIADPDFWYWRYTYYPNQYGMDCCSDYSISFHYQSPADMYTLEFLIYKLRPYGIQYSIGHIPNILKKSTNVTNRKIDRLLS